MKDQSRRISLSALILLCTCFITATVGGIVWLTSPAEVVQERPAAPQWTNPSSRSITESNDFDSEDDPDIVDRSGIASALPSRDSWIGKFNHAKREVIASGKHICEGCGRTPEECGKLTHDAHHEISVERIETETHRDGSKRWKPEMKWSPDNLVILCRPSTAKRTNPGDHGCHFNLGHNGQNWKVSNPNVRADAATQFDKLNPRMSYAKKDSEYVAKKK